MKKIMFVVSTLNTGGAQKILSNLLVNLPDEYEADIVLNDTENIVYPYKGNIISLGLACQADKTKLSYQMRVFLKRIRKIKKLKKTGEYTACISALTSANVVNILTKEKKCRVIVSEHAYMSEEQGKGIKKFLISNAIRLLYNKADQVVTVSKGVEKDLVSRFGVNKNKTIAIYNGFPLKEIKKMSDEPLQEKEKEWIKSEALTLVTIGRIIRTKGQWHLIRALSRVKKAFPAIRLLILGEGELEAALKKLVMDLDLEGSVIFCGFQKNPYRLMKRCDALVFPSLYEGFGNVIVEGLCCGLPCISTDFNVGAREILAPDTDMDYRISRGIEKAEYGILCPVCDGVIRGAHEKLTCEEETLADAIIELLQNKELREHYRSVGCKRAEDFDMENLIWEWLKVIENETQV
ncbi:MAG: glycosyltransferase [Lachnospiraceae bacterium]|nr:glycosyltransferase [Lachnospiraceae bacterium]